ncbi:MAG: hypothetical protein JKX76_01560 [Colwellia sp.]|nr:hypothetical protein [Colwellia sp.]
MNVYKRYLRGCFSSNLLGAIEFTIATDSMLESVTSLNTEISMTINFLGKDILGQLGCLGIVSKIGKYSDKSPTNFFKNTFYLQQACVLTESLTWIIPAFSNFHGSSALFFLTAGIANIGKNVSFINFGAINAKCIPKIKQKMRDDLLEENCSKGLDVTNVLNEQLILDDSEQNNSSEGMDVGEIYSKVNVVSTLGSSIGMMLGLGIIYTIPSPALRSCLIPALALMKYYTLEYTFKGLYETEKYT